MWFKGEVDGKEDSLNRPSSRVCFHGKEDQIREALTIQLNCTDIILIRGYLGEIDSIQKNIEELESEIRKRIAPLRKDIAIVMSVPGIGFVSAVVILAEIGNYNDFDKAEQLADWCGARSVGVSIG